MSTRRTRSTLNESKKVEAEEEAVNTSGRTSTRRRTKAAPVAAETSRSTSKVRAVVENDSETDEPRVAGRRKRAEPAKTTARRKPAASGDPSDSEVPKPQVSASQDDSPPKQRKQTAKRKRGPAAANTDDENNDGNSSNPPKRNFGVKTRRVRQKELAAQAAAAAAATAAAVSSSSSSVAAPIPWHFPSADVPSDASNYESFEESSVAAASEIEDLSAIVEDSEVEEDKPAPKRRKLKDRNYTADGDDEMELDLDDLIPAPVKSQKKIPPVFTEAAKRRSELQKRQTVMKAAESQIVEPFQGPSEAAMPTNIPSTVPSTEPMLEPKFEPLREVSRPNELCETPMFEPRLGEEDEHGLLESDSSAFFHSAPLGSFRVFHPMAEPPQLAVASPPPIAAPYIPVPTSSVRKTINHSYIAPPTNGYNLNPIPPVGGGAAPSPHTPYHPPANYLAFGRPRAFPISDVKPDPIPHQPPFVPRLPKPAPILPAAPDPLDPDHVDHPRIRIKQTAWWQSSWAICAGIFLIFGMALVLLSPMFASVPNEAATLDAFNKAVDDNSVRLYDYILDKLQHMRGQYECGESEVMEINQYDLVHISEDLFPHDEFQYEYRMAICRRFLERVLRHGSEIQTSTLVPGFHNSTDLEAPRTFYVLPDIAIRSLSCIIADWLYEKRMYFYAAAATIVLIAVCVFWYKRRNQREDRIRGLVSRVHAKLMTQQQLGLTSPGGSLKKYVVIDQLEDEFFNHATRTAADRQIWSEVRRRIDLDRRVRNAPRNYRGQDVDTWEWLPE